MSESLVTPDQVVVTSKQSALRNAVASKIFRMQGALLGDNPQTEARAKAAMSKLRKASSNTELVDPEAWQLVLGASGLGARENRDEMLPTNLLSTQDAPNAYEKSAYLALTSYALHQQSQREPMHQPGKRFARAVGELVYQTTPSVKTRFDSLAKSQDTSAITYHLRSLITLLRSNSIGFDYGLFVVDLKQVFVSATRQKVLMRWSRDFVTGYQAPRKSGSSTI